MEEAVLPSVWLCQRSYEHCNRPSHSSLSTRLSNPNWSDDKPSSTVLSKIMCVTTARGNSCPKMNFSRPNSLNSWYCEAMQSLARARQETSNRRSFGILDRRFRRDVLLHGLLFHAIPNSTQLRILTGVSTLFKIDLTSTAGVVRFIKD
jgi:hypothetical protein